MINDIFNYVQLTDRVGTSGQPSAEQFHDIAAAGYKVVINFPLCLLLALRLGTLPFKLRLSIPSLLTSSSSSSSLLTKITILQ